MTAGGDDVFLPQVFFNRPMASPRHAAGAAATAAPVTAPPSQEHKCEAGVRGGGAWRGCGAGVQGGGAGRWLHCRSLQAAQLHEAPKTFRKPNQAYGRPVTSLQQSCDWLHHACEKLVTGHNKTAAGPASVGKSAPLLEASGRNGAYRARTAPDRDNVNVLHTVPSLAISVETPPPRDHRQ